MIDHEYYRLLSRAIGKRLYGDTWKIRLAELLDCDRSTITLRDTRKRKFSKLAAKELDRLAKNLGIKKSDIDMQLGVD